MVVIDTLFSGKPVKCKKNTSIGDWLLNSIQIGLVNKAENPFSFQDDEKSDMKDKS